MQGTISDRDSSQPSKKDAAPQGKPVIRNDPPCSDSVAGIVPGRVVRLALYSTDTSSAVSVRDDEGSASFCESGDPEGDDAVDDKSKPS